MLKNGWTDIVILRNWEGVSEVGDAGNPGGTEATRGSSSKLSGKPEPVAMSLLKASNDNRQRIFKSFMQEHPCSFDLRESKPPGG